MVSIDFCYDEMGWSFTPLWKKQPILKGWQTKPRPTLKEVKGWLQDGNVGLRTGTASGVVVIDVDPGGDVSKLNLPLTVVVETGRGGRHYYFKMPEGVRIGNSAGKLGKNIDVKGENGQVVFVGSTHPDTGKMYKWIFSPKDVLMADLPQNVIDKLIYKPNAKSETRINNVVTTAVSTVLNSRQGERNNALNRAAFAIGQLTSYINVDDEITKLETAARQTGLEEDEIAMTIASGVSAGKNNPRVLEVEEAETPAKEIGEYILTPGGHYTSDKIYVEQSNSTFVDEVIQRLPDDIIYRRNNLPGEIDGMPGRRQWKEMKIDDVRIIVDRHVKLGYWSKAKNRTSLNYKPCTRDMGGVILSGLAKAEKIRELRLLVSYPVYNSGWEIAEPGWNEGGIFYDMPASLRNLNPISNIKTIREVLEDLVVDFPFADEASRQNFFGLMLTPIVTHACGGNRPLHLIIASIERTGKTKLAEEVFGGVVLGRQSAAMQITDRDEERDKRLLALLLLGETIVHLDNLPQRVDSAALASMLTATHYQGRMLGSTKILSLENNLTVVGSGNNVECSAEIVKRAIPIELQPKTDAPEKKRTFKYPNLGEHIRENRKVALEALLGMVELWKRAGRPTSKDRMGGFETWSEVVGGIMGVCGFNRWRRNETQWRVHSSPELEELRVLVEHWWQEYGSEPLDLKTIGNIAKAVDVYGDVFAKKPPAKQRMFFGNLLTKKRNTPVAGYIIKKLRTPAGNRYGLLQIQQ